MLGRSVWQSLAVRPGVSSMDPRGDIEAEIMRFFSNWQIRRARITMIVSMCRECSKSRLYFSASPNTFIAPVHCFCTE